MITKINTILLPLENLIKKYRKYIGYFLIFISFCSLTLIVFRDYVKATGEQARNILLIILFLPIFSRVFGIKIATTIMPLRKELGILMGSLAFVHGGGYIIQYPSFIGDTSFWWQDGQIMYFGVGFIALIMTLPLLLTSNVGAMKKLGRNWKRLHRLVYGIALFTILHIILISWYKNTQTPWYSNIDIIIQIVIITLYFLGKILEWKGVTFEEKGKKKFYPKGQKWICPPCGYIYDPLVGDEDSGILPGTEFSDIPADWRCPVCGVTKSDFIPYDGEKSISVYEAIITHKILVNPTTLELTIECEDDLISKPGQFISFVWKDALGEFIRQYSIVEKIGKSFIFTIKLSEEGRGSKLLREIPTSTKIHINGVFGTFLLKEIKNPKIFIATGTGLAPIYNMISTLPPDANKALYFSVGTEGELFYREKLRAIPNFDLHIHITREKVEGYEEGRVDIDTIKADDETEWYLCGNPRMISEAKEKLEKRGFTKIYSEEFL